MLNRLKPAARLGAAVDSWLAERPARAPRRDVVGAWRARMLETSMGTVRLVDVGIGTSCVVIVPDGPNTIEHCETLIALLSQRHRVICFDMPGFGFSVPRRNYHHSLDQGASVVLSVLDQLAIPRATLAFSCANGFYALRAAAVAPTRVTSLFLSQTPSLRAMHAWARRVIPVPIRVPVVGQTAAWLSRKRLADRWYDMALPRETSRDPWRATAAQAFDDGACFALAGVVQALLAESQAAIEGVSTPCTLVWGNADRTHRATDPASLRACATSTEVVRLDRTGHFPDLERPTRYAELLNAHIARLPPAAVGTTTQV